MKNKLKKLLGIVLSAAILAVSAAAADPMPISAASDFVIENKEPGSILVYGKVTVLENGSIQLENSNEHDPYNHIILHISDKTRIIDAVTGDPVAFDRIVDGDTIYAYTSRIMALSLPPQSGAEVLIVNIPADYAVPAYFEVQSVTKSGEGAKVILSTDGMVNLTITEDCVLMPYLTRNIITMDSLVPGTQLLAWYDFQASSYPAQATPSKLLVFPYSYDGYAELTPDGQIAVMGEMIQLDQMTAVYRNEDGAIMLPLRGVCEAARLSVDWDNEAYAATVTRADGTVVEIPIGSQEILVGGEMGYLGTASELTLGRTYLSAQDMARIFNLSIVTRW